MQMAEGAVKTRWRNPHLNFIHPQYTFRHLHEGTSMPSFRLPFPASKEQLIQQLSSGDNRLALKAAAELQERLCFQDGSLHGINLSRANLREVRLAKASLRGIVLSEAVLSGAYFGASDLEGANLQNALLGGANLREAKLANADLSGADLSGAHLAQANLRGATLRGANLNAANLWRTALHGADLTGASLRGANLYLTDFDTETVLPDGSFWTVKTDLARFT
jgi:hypothetical protein